MTPKKIIVHIGAGKCGSTSLQRTLIKNKALLTEHNHTPFTHDDFPDIVTAGINSYALAALPFEAQYTEQIKLDFDETKAAQSIQSELLSASGTPILSSEYLFGINPARRDARLKFLSSILSAFDDVTIVLYFRAPDSYIRSLYMQWFTPDFTVSFDEFLKHFDCMDSASPFYSLDFEDHINAIKEIINPARIKFELLENVTAKNQTLFENFLSLSGITLPAQNFADTKIKNKSLPAEDFALLYHHKDKLTHRERHLFYNYLRYCPSNSSIKHALLYDKQSHIHVIEHYTPMIKSLASEFKFDDSIVLKDMVHRSEKHPDNLASLKSEIDKTYPLARVKRMCKIFASLKYFFYFWAKIKARLER